MARILVIDDDAAVRTAIATVLKRQGLDVVVVKDGQSGIDAIQQEKFDVVIVDIFMPGMDGLESIRAFKRYAPSVPMIAISGFMFRDSSRPAPDFLAMATKLGAAYSLHKPFRATELLRLVDACLTDAAAPPADPLSTPADVPDASSDPDIIAMAPDLISAAAPELHVIAATTPKPHVIAAAVAEPEIMAAPSDGGIVAEPMLNKSTGH
jgi:CheY-like chemotaxis protein